MEGCPTNINTVGQLFGRQRLDQMSGGHLIIKLNERERKICKKCINKKLGSEGNDYSSAKIN
jgi:hypothetical protein